jgi:hypothetical protein
VTLTDSKCRFVARKSFSAPTERKVKEKRDDFKTRVQEEARRVLEAQAHPKGASSQLGDYLDRWFHR